MYNNLLNIYFNMWIITDAYILRIQNINTTHDFIYTSLNTIY